MRDNITWGIFLCFPPHDLSETFFCSGIDLDKKSSWMIKLKIIHSKDLCNYPTFFIVFTNQIVIDYHHSTVSVKLCSKIGNIPTKTLDLIFNQSLTRMLHDANSLQLKKLLRFQYHVVYATFLLGINHLDSKSVYRLFSVEFFGESLL